jgi:CRP-like cAMP-binding protein
MDERAFGNGLLSTLEPELLEHLSPRPRLVEIARGEVLIPHGQALEAVYFPVSGLVGILAETPDGDAVDSALIGKEGGVGIFEACGSRRFSGEAVVHVPGLALRMAAQAYRQLFELSPSLRTAVHRYVEQCINETRQSLLCTATHDMDARLSRLILEANREGAARRHAAAHPGRDGQYSGGAAQHGRRMPGQARERGHCHPKARRAAGRERRGARSGGMQLPHRDPGQQRCDLAERRAGLRSGARRRIELLSASRHCRSEKRRNDRHLVESGRGVSCGQ